MSDYIRRGLVKLNYLANLGTKNSYKAKFEALVKAVDEAPKVDAVKVIPCEQCRYWKEEVDEHTHWVCCKHSSEGKVFQTLPNFFCAEGETDS